MLLPKLSAHLPKASAGAADGDWEETATARTLAALGNVIENGDEPSRPLILACLFADFHHVAIANGGESQRLVLVEFLRERGFSRADTDHMRLLLEAATHMRLRTRLARRIVRRPYYGQARQFFELIAPTYHVEVEAFDRFLAEVRDQPPRHRRTVSAITPGTAHRELAAASSSAPPGRRRRRRGGAVRRARKDLTRKLEPLRRPRSKSARHPIGALQMMRQFRLTSHCKPRQNPPGATLATTIDSRIHADALFAGRVRILRLVQIGLIDYF